MRKVLRDQHVADAATPVVQQYASRALPTGVTS
jgi:hypothetical protein